MLQTAYDKLSALKSAGKSMEQAVLSNPLKELDAEWSRGLFKTHKWISLVYNGLD